MSELIIMDIFNITGHLHSIIM